MSAPSGRSVLQNSAFLIVAEVLRRIFSLVTVILIGRSLGVEGFGQYSFVLSFVAVFGGFANFGLDTVLIRDVARDPRRTKSQFTATLILKLLTSSLTVGVLAVAISWLDYPAATVRAVYLMGLASIFFALADTAGAVCIATQRMEYASLLSAARGVLLIAALAAGFLLFGPGLLQAIAAQLVSGVLLLAFGMLVATGLVAGYAPGLDREVVGRVLRGALPFVLITGISMLGFRVDVLLLSHLAGDAAVGVYSSAFTPIEMVLSVAQLLTQALFPALSQAFGASPEVLRRLASRSLKVYALLALPMAAGLAVLAPQILALMFTEEFGVATGTLRILAATVWIGFLQVFMGWLVTAADRLRSLIGVNVLGLVTGVGLNLLLIPHYGAAGAAISQAIVSIVALSVLAAVAHRARIVTLSGSRLPRILLATAAMGLVTWVAREFNTLLVVGFAAALYFALIWGMRVVDATELEELRRLRPGLPADSSS